MDNSQTNVRAIKVFLCHSSEDKPLVREIYELFRQDGINPWLDEADLLPGQEWELEIRKAVRSCDVILVCLSSASVGKEGYVQKEIKFALDLAEEKPEGTIFIIPLKLDKCEVPSQLNKWQWIAYGQNDWYKKLVQALRQRCISLNLSYLPGDGPIEQVGKPIEENSGRLLYKSVHLRELIKLSKEGIIDKGAIEIQPTNRVIGITFEAISEALSSFTEEKHLIEEKELILELIGIREPYTYWQEKNSKIHCFQNKNESQGGKMTIVHKPVSSSNISSIGYDPENCLLEIQFHDGSVYQYYEVPSHVYNGLMTANSHGTYLHQVIISGGYAYRKIS